MWRLVRFGFGKCIYRFDIFSAVQKYAQVLKLYFLKREAHC